MTDGSKKSPCQIGLSQICAKEFVILKRITGVLEWRNGRKEIGDSTSARVVHFKFKESRILKFAPQKQKMDVNLVAVYKRMGYFS